MSEVRRPVRRESLDTLERSCGARRRAPAVPLVKVRRHERRHRSRPVTARLYCTDRGRRVNSGWINLAGDVGVLRGSEPVARFETLPGARRTRDGTEGGTGIARHVLLRQPQLLGPQVPIHLDQELRLIRSPWARCTYDGDTGVPRCSPPRASC